MTIHIAQHSGFCYGVKRAIQILDNLIDINPEPKNIFTLGPIIHNRQVTDYYEDKGIKIVEKITDLKLNQGFESNLVIRSHGAPKSVYDEATQLGVEILDATCPYVKKIQNTVSTYASKGYNIIIVGDSNHPEVLGINGWCDNQAVVIENLDELWKIQNVNSPVCVVAQTTYNVKLWDRIVEKIKNDIEDCVVFNTICLATEQRQQSCYELASKVDLMIVVGGKHSSNTIKLAKISSKIVKTIHIETKDDLDGIDLTSIEVLGITAGASTPDWIIQSVILKIENEGEVFFDGKS